MKKNITAFALVSGGLDSILAARIVKEQGINVIGLNFSTGFCNTIDGLLRKKYKTNDILKIKEDYEFPIEIVDISYEYLNVLMNPRYGYGENINPCIDCHIFMLKKAKSIMEERKGHFIITGEVVSQRPMSQFKNTLNLIEKQSGLKGILLRPLSAKLFQPTIPEQEGWVDREKLYDISGRSRKRQIQLAIELGIESYMQPAGGCVLTDSSFANRFNDLIKHKKKEIITKSDLELLKVGRHLRFSNEIKVIVGRDERDNSYLDKFSFALKLRTVDIPGPTTVVDGTPNNEEIQRIAAFTASYSDGKNSPSVKIEINKNGIIETINVKPVDKELMEMIRV
ncbi:tRNA 4-thiouridine(8) synthase ThiI [candidate division KSB1 bacterium]